MAVDVFRLKFTVKFLRDLLGTRATLLFGEYVMEGRVFVFGVGLALLPETLGADDFSIRVGLLPRG